jgi:hypothetical protein
MLANLYSYVLSNDRCQCPFRPAGFYVVNLGCPTQKDSGLEADKMKEHINT